MRKPAQDRGSQDPSSDNEEGNNRTDGLEERRRKLEAELASRRPVDNKSTKAEWDGKNSYAKAFQLSTEFVAAIFVGALLGYLIDRFIGTTPWGMILFLLLGFVAGILNVMRSAGVIAQNSVPGTDDKDNNDANG